MRDKNLRDKTFTHESRGREKGKNFLQAKISGYFKLAVPGRDPSLTPALTLQSFFSISDFTCYVHIHDGKSLDMQ